MPKRLEILGIPGLPEVRPGDDLVALTLEGLARLELAIEDNDVLVLTQKVISKAEARIVPLTTIEPSPMARRFAETSGGDPRHVEVVLQQAQRIVKMDRGVLIVETKHGLVCAHAGVDASNLSAPDEVSLLPDDPDASATTLREQLESRTDRQVAVIISDTFGRPWREGQTNIAIGVSGMAALMDYRGQTDGNGHSLRATVIAVADELAGASELVMGKLDRTPVALIRGWTLGEKSGHAAELVRSPERDLFR